MSRADFSTLRFNLMKHYRNVLSQQGRVWLDSDWNEESETRAWQDEERSLDLIGRCGVPAPYTAFRISRPATNSVDFRIGGGALSDGDFYVDGILCRNENPTTYLTQPDLPVAPRLEVMPDGSPTFALAYLEVWERLITNLEDDTIREVALGGPDTAVRSKTIAQVRFLKLDGAMSCADAASLLPSPLGHGTLTTLQSPQPPDPADICRLPQEVTFTGRENRLYRVEIHEQGDTIGGAGAMTRFSIALGRDAAAGALSLVLGTALTPLSAARLRDGGTVTLTDDAGRRENIFVTGVDNDSVTLRFSRPLRNAFTTAAHTSVSGGLARFKWSASNGAFAVGVKDVSADRTKLTLTSLGRDAATALRDGDLVEISDDASELGIGRGHLTHLDGDPNPDELTVVLEEPLPASTFDLQRHMTLRRWDGEGFAATAFDEIATPWMNLGDGVHIQFGGYDLRVAEYWQFTTRVTGGTVEHLADARPRGIVRHRCPLALVKWGLISIRRDPNDPIPDDDHSEDLRIAPLREGTLISPPQLIRFGAVLSDCRPRIPLLTRMIQLHYVGGDGQECMAGEQLKRPIQVGITNGPFAMPGMTVRFSSTHPSGVLTGGGSTGQFVDVVTDSAGEAGCLWTPPPIADTHTVMATLVLTPEDAILCEPLRVVFNAKVDEPPVIEPVMVVTKVTDKGERPIENDQDLEYNRFISGIKIVLDHMPERDSIQRPTVFVSIEVPERDSDFDLGFYTLLLRGELKTDSQTVMWVPDARVRRSLAIYLANLKEERYLVRLTMLGNFIWATDDVPRYLDGDSFAEPQASPIVLHLPSGDTRRGGDFRMWFWLTPPRRRRKLVFNGVNAQIAAGVSLVVHRAELEQAAGPDYTVDLSARFNLAEGMRLLGSATVGLQLPLLTTPDLERAASAIASDLNAARVFVNPTFLTVEKIVSTILSTRDARFFILLPDDEYDRIRTQLPEAIRDAIVEM
ncbi:MAG TPA: DUF6519 domain-containing protein [Thermoanaerobaculia bacterium]|nr:DUF6519 domain-containing protein [Thermoanaerobaculia bacterium]